MARRPLTLALLSPSRLVLCDNVRFASHIWGQVRETPQVLWTPSILFGTVIAACWLWRVAADGVAGKAGVVVLIWHRGLGLGGRSMNAAADQVVDCRVVSGWLFQHVLPGATTPYGQAGRPWFSAKARPRWPWHSSINLLPQPGHPPLERLEALKVLACRFVTLPACHARSEPCPPPPRKLSLCQDGLPPMLLQPEYRTGLGQSSIIAFLCG